jgi:hypothetical protein
MAFGEMEFLSLITYYKKHYIWIDKMAFEKSCAVKIFKDI